LIKSLTATNPSAVAEEFVAKTIWAPNIALRHQQQSCRRFQTQLSQYTTLATAASKRTKLISRQHSLKNATNSPAESA
jgi:hypothetical protein